jgi:hypothetical protein
MNELFKDLIYLTIIFFLAYVVFYLSTRHDTVEQRVKRYDCNLTEFIPNVPDDIRLACRQQKLDQINKN